MKVLVVGASGATGRLLVRALLQRGLWVVALVRSAGRMPDDLRQHEHLTIVEATVLELDERQLQQHLHGCSAVASCLGHNLSWRGIFGPPRRLVADSIQQLCAAIKANPTAAPMRLVLMNTAGNRNPDAQEPRTVAEHLMLGLIRLLLPPHRDNEAAAEYLRLQVGYRDQALNWVVVRPDSLIDAEQESPYQAHPSPTRSAIFNAGQTSRINVASFMAALLTDDQLWQRWQGQMPVIYNGA